MTFSLGCFLLWSAFFSNGSHRDPSKITLRILEKPFLDYLGQETCLLQGVRVDTSKGNNPLLVFFPHGSVCPGCLYEVEEYVSVFAEHEGSSPKIQSIALIVESDTMKALRFCRLSGLKLPTYYWPTRKFKAFWSVGPHPLPFAALMNRNGCAFTWIVQNSVTPVEGKRTLTQHVLDRFKGPHSTHKHNQEVL